MRYRVTFQLEQTVEAEGEEQAITKAQHDLLEQLTSMDHWRIDELAEQVNVKKKHRNEKRKMK